MALNPGGVVAGAGVGVVGTEVVAEIEAAVGVEDVVVLEEVRIPSSSHIGMKASSLQRAKNTCWSRKTSYQASQCTVKNGYRSMEVDRKSVV